MTALLGALFSLYLLYLLWEAHAVRIARKKLAHVVHVNGTRGKSTVSRLIEAGLRAGGLRVFCKTTGTDPMTIDVNGREELICRRGKANIKEQIAVLRRAAAQNAQVLVVECMAITPEFQQTSQHDILRADIGVITNVRRDHMDVMGDTLPRIADALCHTVPRRGYPVHGRDCHDGVAEGCRREKRKQLCLRRSPGRRGDARLSRERRPCACCL